MKVEITKAQLLAIICITDDISGMIGSAEDYDEKGNNWDNDTKKRVRLVDRFLKKNGYKREYA